MNPTLDLQVEIRDTLAADPVLTANGATVVMQDQADFSRVLEEGLGLAEGPVIAIAIERCENYAPGLVIHWKLYVMEAAPVNREREHFLTALAAAWRCVELLDGATHLWGDLEQTLYEEGTQQVSLTFKTTTIRSR